MPAVNVKNVMEWFGVDDVAARHIANNVRNAQDAEDVDIVLDLVNEYIRGHGVEAIRGDYHVDNYYFDIVALYVNTGDAYSPTLLYETDTDRFMLTTWGDWVERNERKYSIR
jgi:hypothetical protein